jgi:hypothetical protein
MVENNWQNNIDESWTSLYKFIDWNNDSYTDVILRYPRDNNVVLLFNPKKEKFVKFGDFGESIDKIDTIKDTHFMFNLDEHKLNWNSELFAINENYKKVSYGVMHWVEGDTSSYISVYKRLLVYDEQFYNNVDRSILDNQKKPTEKIDTKALAFFLSDNFEKRDSLRQDFVKKYWSKNWKRFL